jgi:hypothetical protein
MARPTRKTKYAIEVNGIHFTNGESLKKFLRELIDCYLWDGCPSEVSMSDEHASFLIELVRLRCPSRIPEGQYVKDVLRTTREGQVGRHVCFVYGNGERDMIGWTGLCSSGKSPRHAANDALRHAVWSQTSRVYSKAFAGTQTETEGDWLTSILSSSRICVCPKSGLRLSETGEFADDVGVVHHDGMPYADIVKAWMDQYGHTHETLPLVELQIGGWRLEAGDIRDSWEAFHAMHAELVVVSKKWHEQHHAEERKKTKERVDVIAPTTTHG